MEDFHKGLEVGIGEVWFLWDFESLRMEIMVESLEKHEQSTGFDGSQKRDIVETRGVKTEHDYLQTECGSLVASLRQTRRQRVLANFPFGSP